MNLYRCTCRGALQPGTVGLLQHADEHGARARTVELAEEDALPGAERQLAVAERNHDLRPHQSCTNVRGSILLALLDVLPAPTLRSDPLERHLEVAGDHRVGVLVDREARRGVRDIDEHGRTGGPLNGVPDLGRDVEQLRVALGLDPQRVHGAVS